MAHDLIVQLFAPTQGEKGRIGTAYPVARNVLLTAAHVIRDVETGDLHSPIEKVRASLDAEDIDAATWREMAELGWLGINVPAEFGGVDLGLGSVIPVVESMGKHLMGSPFIFPLQISISSMMLSMVCLRL